MKNQIPYTANVNPSLDNRQIGFIYVVHVTTISTYGCDRLALPR